MFIREIKKQRSGTSGVFYQYYLAQSARVNGKVQQRIVLYLGSEELMRDPVSRRSVLEILKSRIFKNDGLFSKMYSADVMALAERYLEKYRIKYEDAPSPMVSVPPAAGRAEFHSIDIKSLEVNEVRSFGAEHLCQQMMEKLGLGTFLTGLGMSRDEVRLCLVSIASKALFASSEYKTAQILDMNSALNACLGYSDTVTHKDLYKVTDTLYSHQEKIDQFLYKRIAGMFDLEDKLVIFDISNTYFETRRGGSKIARHGRSKEKRSDCPLVVFTGVINAEGFIRHSRIYEGNKADTLTLPDMIADLERHSPPDVKQTVVMDAGIASEDNLELLKAKGYHYVCVSRKRLSDYTITQDEKVIEMTDRGNQKVALAIFKPAGFSDTWMQVCSDQKRVKEQSIDLKLKDRFLCDMAEIERALSTKSGTKKIAKVWERIGRTKQKHHHVSGRFDVKVTDSEGLATAISWTEKTLGTATTDKQNGVYFIRTNYENMAEKELWTAYNTIREVEATFRCLKSDLQIRPVYHRNDGRVKAHIYLTTLAYSLVNTIRYMLAAKGIHHDWCNIKRIMSTQTIQTLELPTDKKQIHLRKPSKPIKEVLDIYHATGCSPSQLAVKKSVVYH